MQFSHYAVLAALLAIVLFFVDVFASTEIKGMAMVQERYYSPSHTTVGAGTKGRTTVYHESEKYTIIAIENGIAYEVSADLQVYSKAVAGYAIPITHHYGCLSGYEWETTAP